MKQKIALIFTVLTLGIASASYAQDGAGMNADEHRGYLGGLVGLVFANGSSDITFGGDAIYKFNRDWGVGAYVTYFGDSSTIGTLTSNTSTTILAAEGNYFFNEALRGAHAGVKAGFAINHAEVSGQPDANSTDFTFGPALGYDYELAKGFSLGAEFNVMFVTKSGSDALVNVLGAIKWWF